MVIQRLQTIWLLVAVALMVVYCFMPMALLSDSATTPESISFLHPLDFPVLMVVGILSAVLLAIAIFLYKNMKRQKTVTLVSMLLVAVVGAMECILLFGWDGGESHVEWLGSICLLPGAFVFALLGYLGIRKDEKLLKAADRLR